MKNINSQKPIQIIRVRRPKREASTRIPFDHEIQVRLGKGSAVEAKKKGGGEAT